MEGERRVVAVRKTEEEKQRRKREAEAKQRESTYGDGHEPGPKEHL